MSYAVRNARTDCSRLLPVNAVNRNSFIQFVHQRGCARGKVRRSEVLFELCREFAGVVVSVAAFIIASVGGVHVGKYRLPVDGLIKRLGRAWAVGIFSGVFLVGLGFLFGAFGRTLPVSAELVVDEGKGGEAGLARCGDRT